MKQIFTLLTLALLASVAVAQQTGTIRGTVVSGETGEPQPFANVVIAGTSTGAQTDFDGNFSITGAPAGTVSLVCSIIAFAADTVEVTVPAGGVAVVNFSMVSKAEQLKTFVKEAKASRSNEAAMTVMQQKDARVTNVTGSEQMTRQGDGSAAQAATRVSGVTVEGGKYLYVRGLSDRYSKTTLNGAEIPGLDPNRNSVQMDLFPTNLLDNISVVKSFTPDLPGSFTGGLVNIATKDFPEKETFQFSTSVGYNPQANYNNNFLTANRGKLDIVGFDDGTRAVPHGAAVYVPPLFENNERLEATTKEFNKDMTPTRKQSGLNQSHAISYGNQKDLKNGRSMGYVAGLTYQRSFSYYDNGKTGRYSLTSPVDEVDNLNAELILNDSRGQENVIWGALVNFSYKMSSKSKIGLTLMRNQNGISTSRYQEGSIPSDQVGLHFQTRAVQYQERSLSTAQLSGEHLMGKKLTATWMGSYTLSEQDEPDLRFFANDFTLAGQNDGDTMYNLQAALYPVPVRYFRHLAEHNGDAKVHFELLLKEEGGKKSKLKWGVSNVYKLRTFTEARYDYNSQSLNYNGNPADYLADENMEINNPDGFLYISDGSEERNQYTGTENVAAAYAMADYWVTPRVRLIGGVRAEQTNITVESDDSSLPLGELNNIDLLPALNTVYVLRDDAQMKMNLRFAYSRTLARPTFRELAPFGSFDFIGDFIVVGNDQLERTLIDNIDLRWEMYPGIGEVVSAGVFYKNFKNPIERTFNPIAANPELNYRNVDAATVYGAEVELKKSLKAISKKLSNFTMGANFTYVYSQVNINEAELAAIRATDPGQAATRTMFGQSPYIANAFLTYNNDSTGTMANLGFNVSGEKIAVVIEGGTPNVYDKPTPQLDFTLTQNISKKWSVKLGARNLLNPRYRQVYTFKGEEYNFNSYSVGRTFSAGVKYLIN